MNFSTARSERITAIVSTVVAVAILAGGVVAYQSHNAPVDDIVQLESDLRFQLEVAFKHDPNERVARLATLEQVTQAWRQSSRQLAGREKFATWLLEATIRSMPGSIEALPAVPDFTEQASATQHVARTVKKDLPVSSQRLVPVPPGSVAVSPTDLSSAKDFVASAVVSELQDVESEASATETIIRTQPVTFVLEAKQPVRINLPELSARIAGYHEGLNEVETALLTLRVNDLAAIADLIRQLDEMTRDFQFIKMYYQALTEEERQAVTSPRSMIATLTEIERRLDQSQAALSDDFLDEFESGRPDPTAQLHQQLAAIASRVDW